MRPSLTDSVTALCYTLCMLARPRYPNLYAHAPNENDLWRLLEDRLRQAARLAGSSASKLGAGEAALQMSVGRCCTMKGESNGILGPYTKRTG